ncbi:MAG: M23 family metallopeptidase, partial [Calditrichaeota bacterium]
MKIHTFIRSVTFVSIIFLIPDFLFAQNNYPWPVTPFDQNHLITGTFCEYRSTTTPAHFHNGTDIPKADGSPVYSVRDGIVTTIYGVGSNAYVRVQDKAYVHISPNPSLSVGDSVYASQTILGYILSGQGHVHFTNGYAGAEVNSMLTTNSFTPLVDTWAPDINYVLFYQNNTSNQFTTNELSGPVDIIVKVSEKNGPPGSSTSVLNNGTYKIGYRILSEDSSTVVYEPPNGGLRFQFNSKPNNSYVDIVFFRSLSSTSSHVYQVTNNLTSDNYWDTRSVSTGNYVVMVFTEDTRGNGTTAYIPVRIVPQDVTPPEQPLFKALKGRENDIHLSWYPNSAPDLLGYRLFFSYDNVLWTLFRDETVLTPAITDTSLRLVLNTDVYFQLTAVDNAPLPNESIPSDIYGLSNGSSFQGKVLLVDGFDRIDGAWPNPYHFFGFTYGTALTDNGFSFDTVPNEAVEDSLVNLNDYEAVVWFLGDESISDETFSNQEQLLIMDYLENGGNLFVNGSRIATDLDPDAGTGATTADELFLNDYLKADFQKFDTTGKMAAGVNGTIFDGISLAFGQIPYGVDSADVL